MYEHDHHSHDRSSGRALATALTLTLFFAAVEALAGWWTHSLALLADAGHMLTDSTALGLAALAAWIARRPADRRHTWGHGRVEILAALINGMIMVALVTAIAISAVKRFQDPPEIRAWGMLGVAVIGLFVNLSVLAILRRGQSSLNLRAARLHVIGDLLGSVVAITAGAVILTTGWTPVDPLLSLVICALILIAGVRLLREGVGVVMEGVPRGLELEDVHRAMRGVPGVVEIHDLHIWQVDSRRQALSAHVVLDDLDRWMDVLAELNAMLLERFDIDHPTLQPELADPGCVDGPGKGC